MGLHRVTIFCLATALSAAVLADQQADSRAREDLQRAEMLAAQRRGYLSELRSLMPLDQHRMGQILRLGVERGRLELYTSLTPTPIPRHRRADINGIESPAIVTYCESIPDTPRTFEFKLEEYPDRLTNEVIHLVWQASGPPRGLAIVSSRQTRDHFLRVSYNENSSQVVLLGSATDNSGARDAENTSLVESDFATLRRKHPAAVEKWLRPVFHRIQQDPVFAADANAAWQALADDWPLDSGTERQVARLVPELNAPDWQTRNHAAHELVKLGRDGATAIARLSRAGLSLEQNVRLDEILSQFRPLPPEDLQPLRTSANFLLDCEYCDDATVRKLAAARLELILGHRLNLNVHAPESMRAEAIEKIRAELKPADH